MLGFIQNNIGTLIVGFAVLATLVFAAVRTLRDRNGKSSGCGCGCDGCGEESQCETAHADASE